MSPQNTSFELLDDTGNVFVSKEHLPLIIYFYPKNNTPGCTLESIDFSNLQDEFIQLGYQIVGISRDSITSHQKFKDKHNLSTKLLSDSDGVVCQQYDVIKLKNLYGKQVKGIERSTFVLDKQGKIIKEYHKVRAKEHTNTVLADLQEMHSSN